MTNQAVSDLIERSNRLGADPRNTNYAGGNTSAKDSETDPVTGEPLDRIRAGNTERMVAGVPQSREFRTGQPFAGPHRDRQVGVAKQLFSAMGIARDDKDKRQDWVLRGFRQFDAPVCVIVTYDRVLDGSDDTPFDCGAVATALVVLPRRVPVSR